MINSIGNPTVYDGVTYMNLEYEEGKRGNRIKYLKRSEDFPNIMKDINGRCKKLKQ